MKSSTTRWPFFAALSVLLLSSPVTAAVCEDGAGESMPSDAVIYAQKHKIMEAADGLIPVEDTVRVWGRDPNVLCFAVNTVHTNVHLCSLSGEARRIRANVYGYADEGCKVEIEVTPRKVSLRVTDPTDPKRTLCNPVEAFGCGANTAIESGVFMRKK
jgi:hypothetical protein